MRISHPSRANVIILPLVVAARGLPFGGCVIECCGACRADAVQVPSRPACDGRRPLPDRCRLRQQERHAHRALLGVVDGRRADGRAYGKASRKLLHQQLAEQRHRTSTAQTGAVRGSVGHSYDSSASSSRAWRHLNPLVKLGRRASIKACRSAHRTCQTERNAQGVALT